RSGECRRVAWPFLSFPSFVATRSSRRGERRFPHPIGRGPVHELNLRGIETELEGPARPHKMPVRIRRGPRSEQDMTEGSYNQFCPVAMAAEILCTRWTIVLLRELVAGSTRFNELRRGVPRMSPALLSKRLKDLEAAGVVARSQIQRDPEVYEYTLTAAGKDLGQVGEQDGGWGTNRV